MRVSGALSIALPRPGVRHRSGLSFDRALRSLLCGALLAALAAEAQAPVDLRVALVIGNSAYPGAPLLNPGNDAKAMAATLKEMGFQVIEARDATRAQMTEAIARTRDVLKGRSGVGMFYYAGHGLQLDWRNYMVPVDARLSGAADLPGQTVDVTQVIEAFKAAGNRMNIVVLDACRDNPFAGTAVHKGLAQMDAPPGTLLAYATAPGNVAEDGSTTSANGLYTQHLVHELKQPNARIEDVFKRVRFQVRRESQGRQIPWESTSLEDDFYFDPTIKVTRLGDVQRAREAAIALARENAEWNRIKDSTKPDDFYAFLEKFPSGLLSEQAQFRLDQVQKAKIQSQAPANGVQALASGIRRYEKGDEFTFDRLDGYTKISTALVRQLVTSADDRTAEMNGGQEVWDQMGGQLQSRFGKKEPAVLAVPAELAVGKRWRSAYTNTNSKGETSQNYYEFKVVALEEVLVPAGRFIAFRIERTGEIRWPARFLVQSGTHWVDPATMLMVRLDSLNREGGRITFYESEVLVSMKRVPRIAN